MIFLKLIGISKMGVGLVSKDVFVSINNEFAVISNEFSKNL
jgi:hypothetical protein